ncbi:MAG: 50S ribosomal protein L18 [Parvularculales bacterium]
MSARSKIVKDRKSQLHQRRQTRVRTKLAQRGGSRPRLTVYRSLRHIYSQIIDDRAGCTLAAASSRDEAFAGRAGSDKAVAGEVGALIAQRAREAGIESVIFDRGGYLYHGRVKALAEAARKSGLNF